MTTITFKDGVMAADSQATGDYHSRVRKICRLPDGSLVGMAGDYFQCHKFVSWLTKGQIGEHPEMPEGGLLVIRPGTHRASLWLSDGDWPPAPFDDKFAAIGSGAAVAMGAMEAGASAIEAVKIAARHDGSTSGPFHTLKLK